MHNPNNDLITIFLNLLANGFEERESIDTKELILLDID